jgi:multidrug efflux pump subunit AcrA (membrane-fusion protein)
MPTTYSPNGQETRHTDDMQDIITAVPSWLLRWGITLFFAILALIIGLSAFIRYPDIVKASLRIDSPNSPKPVVTKVAGKLVKLLVTEGESVSAGQSLAYLESTADHNKVLMLLANLKQLQQQVLQNKPLNTGLLTQADDLQLGELQGAYQTFYGEYLNYLSSVNNGFLLKKRGYLQKDLDDITKQQGQLNAQKTIEQRDLELAEQEYNVAKKLLQEKAETPTQFRQEESQYLAKKTPLVQTDASLINGNDNYDVQQEKSKFLQALNSLISSTEDWKSKYILTASVAGRVSFQGIIQENEVLQPNQDVFYVNPGNEQFYGDMSISQTSIGKVRVGEKVLIKLKGYPYEEFGMIRGTIKYIADIPYKDSVFMSRVDFKMKNSSDLKKPIHLKQGMTADAEIVTQDATILQRISWSLFKMEH